MNYPVYAYRDIKMGFGRPQPFANEMIAKRNFMIEINDENQVLRYTPSDYELYKIGTYDTDSGKFEGCVPEFICSGIDVYGVNGK